MAMFLQAASDPTVPLVAHLQAAILLPKAIVHQTVLLLLAATLVTCSATHSNHPSEQIAERMKSDLSQRRNATIHQI
jgi:tRNA A37 threonylcarbamoyladenosine synthetase subunit TsaC/SUA5/YrdC